MTRRRQDPPEQPQDPSTGSPAQGGPVYLAAGRLRRSHGIQGEMVMEVLTDFPERLHPGKIVFVGDDHTPIKIASIRGHNKNRIIRLEGVHSPEEAARYRNALLFVKAADLPELPEGAYYHHQLIGLTIVNQEGQVLGKLETILETGANDVYVMKTEDGKEVLLPAVDEVVLEVNLDRGEMRVNLPEWQ